MDCIAEAKKFIQRAREASHREVIEKDLEMADWYLNEALKERDEAQRDEPDGTKPKPPPRMA